VKILIATRADDQIADMTALTHPNIQQYAQKCGAEFISLNQMADCPGNGRFHYRIMEFYRLLEEYDRVLSLDSDILISSKCPNIFDVVPYHQIGTIYEDKGSRANDRHKRIQKAQSTFGVVNWTTGYINTGVFLVSRLHRPIFQKINGNYWTDRGFDDVHLGWQIHKHGFEIYELPFQYNHMSMFSEEWNQYANRFNSYIIHYAGAGIFDKKNRIEQIQNDLKVINDCN